VGLHIYHVIDSLGIGGGQSMLFELHEAISKYCPEWKQDVILLNAKRVSQSFIGSYNVTFHPSNPKLLQMMINDHPGKPIIIFHKLMLSKMDQLRRIYGRCPIICINHTHTETQVYNRIRYVDHVVAVCKNMVKNLQRMGVKTPMSVIHNGVNIEKFDAISAGDRGYSNDVLLTGRVNALNNIKYSDNWVKWCANVHLPKKMVHEYVGPGEHLKKAKSLVEAMGETQNEVKFLGSIPEFEKKIQIIKRWDIFLYEINRHEGLSIAVLEALACGIPVICSNHYGNKEVIEDGVNGFVFNNKDDALNILTELTLNPEMLQNLKVSTKKHFLENLEAKISVQKYRDVIEAVIDRKPLKTVTDYEKAQVTGSIRKRLDKLNKRKRKKVHDTSIDVEPISRGKESNQNLRNDVPNEKFTILTAGYNVSPYLEAWSESLLAQNYRPLDIVFVNDGSKDKTPRRIPIIAEKFKQKGIGFHLYNNPKREFCGTAYALACQQAPNSAYYGIVDADDMLVVGAIEWIVDVYKQHPNIDWIYTQYACCDKYMKPLRNGLSSYSSEESLLELGKKRIHAFSHWRTFSHRIDRNAIFKRGLHSGVDKYMGYRLEELGKGMFVDKICYYYRSGLLSSITSTEFLRKDWENVLSESIKRRQKYNIQPYPIMKFNDSAKKIELST